MSDKNREKLEEMPSRIIDVLSCNDQQRWEFLSCTTIIKPKYYYLNGKCVYCELEAIKEREQKLLEVIKNTDKILRYITESNWVLLRKDLDHLLFEITKARNELAKVETMMKEIGVGK